MSEKTSVVAERPEIGVLVLSVLTDAAHHYLVYQRGELVSEHGSLREVADRLNELAGSAGV